MSDVKIFQMNDYDWVAARSLEEAKAFYLEATDCDPEEAFDDPRELSDEHLDYLRHTGDDGERAGWDKEKIPTFREELAKDLAEGQKVPYLFASTET